MDKKLKSSVSNVGSHTAKMARFIVGSAGLAPDAALYCVEASNFYKNIETLIENGVNVINMSCGFTSNRGKYSVRAKWIDHLAAYHKVAFVKSAGNDGETHKITDPGMAYNAITIGNIDEISPPTLDVNSCKEEDNGIADKPDFTNIGSGTSQAAAITTGIVALMMEKMPSLKKSTRMIKALLAAGTTKDTDHNVMGNNSTSIMTDECGAGFINAYNACRSGYFTKTINSDEVEYNTTTAVRVGQYFRVSIAWHAYSTSKCDGTSGTGSMNIYELNVYQGNVLLATLKNPSNHKNNLLAAEFKTVSNAPLKFVIKRTEGSISDGVCVAYRAL